MVLKLEQSRGSRLARKIGLTAVLSTVLALPAPKALKSHAQNKKSLTVFLKSTVAVRQQLEGARKRRAAIKKRACRTKRLPYVLQRIIPRSTVGTAKATEPKRTLFPPLRHVVRKR